MTSATPFRDATASEVEAAPGSREQKAARYIAARKFGGIPTKAFLLGDNDHSPMMRGVVDLTTEVYKLADLISNAGQGPLASGGPPTAEQWAAILDQNAEIVAMLEDHGCPTSLEP